MSPADLLVFLRLAPAIKGAVVAVVRAFGARDSVAVRAAMEATMRLAFELRQKGVLK